MSKLVNEVLEVAWHRNGIGGRGFYAIRFTSDIDPVSKADGEMWNIPETSGAKSANFLGILTDTPGECYVICTDLLPTCGVKFAGGNSWRGDRYEPELREAISTNETSGGIRLGPFWVPTK